MVYRIEAVRCHNRTSWQVGVGHPTMIGYRRTHVLRISAGGIQPPVRRRRRGLKRSDRDQRRVGPAATFASESDALRSRSAL